MEKDASRFALARELSPRRNTTGATGIPDLVDEQLRHFSIDPQSGAVTEIVGNLPIGLPGTPGGLPSNVPTGVGIGESGTIYFSSDVENAIYKVTKK